MSGPEYFVDHVVEAIEAVGVPLRLVLDDVNLLAGGAPLRDLARLVHRRPANLQLVLATRVDPAVSLSRLRLEGQVHELRADQLRFSLEDTGAMLRAAGLDLAPELVDRLHDRTEGWAAGLRLAAIALRRTDDPARFVSDFSGDERSMADYLTGELLAGFTPETLEFLRAVSICAQMSGGLAVRLTEHEDAARMLDDLSRETALIERQVSDAYRIHPLLRTYLAAVLERHRPALHRRLHATAARWWGRRRRARACAPPRRAVRRRGAPACAPAAQRRGAAPAGQIGAVRAALDLVRPEHRSADPWIALIAGLTHVDERALPAVAAALSQARGAWPSDAVPGLRILRSSVDVGRRRRGLAPAEDALAGADPDTAAPELRALFHASRGTAEFAPGGGGDVELAERDLDTSLRLARTHGFGFLEVQVLCSVALIAAARCHYDRMVGAAEEAIRAASRQGRHPSAWTARASAVLGYADLLSGNPSSARRWAAIGLDTDGDRLPRETLYALRVVHGAARADEGDRAAGFGEIQGARAAGSGMLWPPPVPAALAGLEHRVALLHGNLAAAAEAVAWLERRVGRVGEVILMEALGAAAGRPEVARTAVDPVVGESLPVLLPHTIVEALLVAAEAALRLEDVPAGTVALDRALRLGQTLGIVRPFVLAGPRTRSLLGGRPAARGHGPVRGPARVGPSGRAGRRLRAAE